MLAATAAIRGHEASGQLSIRRIFTKSGPAPSTSSIGSDPQPGRLIASKNTCSPGFTVK